MTVGIDIGSTTSHVMFARLRMQRLADALSSRYVVVERTVLQRSPILLTPFRADGPPRPSAGEAFGGRVPAGGGCLGGAYLHRTRAPCRRRNERGAARTGTGGIAGNSVLAGKTAPYWLKGTRVGGTFSAYYSPDGKTWTLFASQTITMGPNVYIGMGVTSHVEGVLCTATFDNVTATP